MITPPPWRSLLYVPVINRRFVDKAHTRGADGIILDLEDSVPPAEKEAARAELARAVLQAGRGGADVLVRVNRDEGLAAADLEAGVMPGVAAIVLPKADSFEHVRARAEQVEALERARGIAPGTLRLVLLIETPGALLDARAICAADPRTVAVFLGSEDFSAVMGMVSADDTLAVPSQLLAIAARAAGITPMGLAGSIADYRDLEALRATALRSRRLGFEGASCIHPSAVAVLNEAFTPSPEEIEQARRIVAAYGAAQEQGQGAISVGGRMIDVPVAERARALLARAQRIGARTGG